jgi:membrane-associated phospholipid phosphatase
MMAAGLIVLGVALVELSALSSVRAWDLSIVEDLADGRARDLQGLAGTISRLGDTPPVVGVALLVTGALVETKQWRAMLLLPLALSIEVATFVSVNYLVRRPRPSVPKVGSEPSTFSFPSGHVAATLVCWLGLAVLLMAFDYPRTARVIVVLGSVHALMLAWARIYLGMHHPLDVAAGLGMGCGAIVVASWALCLRPSIGTPPDEYSSTNPVTCSRPQGRGVSGSTGSRRWCDP